MKKVIYIAPKKATFVQKDLNFLKEKYEVIYFEHYWLEKTKVLENFFFQLKELFRHGFSSDFIVIMFAGYWSILPCIFGKIFRKKTLIVLGGTETQSYPEFNYGSLRKPIWKVMIGFSFRLADVLVPVHESLVYYEDEYFNGSKQGVKSFFSNLTTQIEVIYNGYEPDKFDYNEAKKEEGTFVCIALVKDHQNFIRKGIDMIFELAQRKPELQFTIIGFDQDYKATFSSIPENVTCIPPCPQKDFLTILQRSRFCLQLSISEGFPNGICEAMLSGCIPIGSSANGIPSIIGDTGLILRKKDIDLLVYQLYPIFALSPESKNDLALRARNRIKNRFPISKRAHAFYNLFERLKHG